MWMVEDANEGRIPLGKCRSGDVAEVVALHLNGKRIFQLQKFLEEEISKGGDFFRIRWLVLMGEELREAIAAFNESQQRTRLKNGSHHGPQEVSA